jgi:hypothetical protein
MSSRSAAHHATMDILRHLMPGKPKRAKEIIRELKIDNGYQLMGYLRSNELIEEIFVGDIKSVIITERGLSRIIKADIENLKFPKHKKWDGKWRIVLFDIPESHKPARDALKNKLKDLGFKQLQKSAYIYPYECLDEIEKIRCFYNIRPYTFLITASHIEGDKKLKQIFKLKGK